MEWIQINYIKIKYLSFILIINGEYKSILIKDDWQLEKKKRDDDLIYRLMRYKGKSVPDLRGGDRRDRVEDGVHDPAEVVDEAGLARGEVRPRGVAAPPRGRGESRVGRQPRRERLQQLEGPLEDVLHRRHRMRQVPLQLVQHVLRHEPVQLLEQREQESVLRVQQPLDLVNPGGSVIISHWPMILVFAVSKQKVSSPFNNNNTEIIMGPCRGTCLSGTV